MAVQPGFAYAAIDFTGLDTGGASNDLGATQGAIDFVGNEIPPNITGQMRFDLLTIGQGGGISILASGRSGQLLEAKVSTAVHVRVFMKSTGDGQALPGLAAVLVIQIAKSGDTSFSTISPTVTDLGSGWYDLFLTTTHTNTLGLANFHVTAPNAVPNDDLVLNIIAVDKFDAVRFGLSALPASNAGGSGGVPVVGAQVPNATVNAAGGLHTIGSGAGQFNTTSGNVLADLQKWLGSTPASLSSPNGFVKAILLRWLTDDAPGTPNALSSGNVPSDSATILNRLGTPAGASVSADIAAVKSDTSGLAGMGPKIDNLHKIAVGRWKIQGTQLLLYDTNGTTVLFAFDLKDDAGNPSATRIFERVPNP